MLCLQFSVSPLAGEIYDPSFRFFINAFSPGPSPPSPANTETAAPNFLNPQNLSLTLLKSELLKLETLPMNRWIGVDMKDCKAKLFDCFLMVVGMVGVIYEPAARCVVIVCGDI